MTVWSPPRQRRWPALVAGVVVGVVVGGGSVGLAWGLWSRPGDAATEDAKAACAELGRLGPLRAGLPDVTQARWLALVELADAAGDADPTYRPLRAALDDASQTESRVYSWDDGRVVRDIDEARTLCRLLT